MIFDFNTPSILGDFLVMPDYPFQAVPVSNVLDVQVIEGSPNSSSMVIQGSVE